MKDKKCLVIIKKNSQRDQILSKYKRSNTITICNSYIQVKIWLCWTWVLIPCVYVQQFSIMSSWIFKSYKPGRLSSLNISIVQKRDVEGEAKLNFGEIITWWVESPCPPFTLGLNKVHVNSKGIRLSSVSYFSIFETKSTLYKHAKYIIYHNRWNPQSVWWH